MLRELKKIGVLILYVFWSLVLFLQVFVWTSWRFHISENALVETMVSVVQDLIWIPVGLGLPFYIWFLAKDVIRNRWLRIAVFVVSITIGFYGLFHLMTYFRYLFLPVLLFFFFLLLDSMIRRHIRLDILIFALSVLVVIFRYQTQLLPVTPFHKPYQHKLKIMSYNILVKQAPEKRKAIIELINKERPDIIFIQEINRYDREYFPRQLPDYPYQLWAGQYDDYNGGAILSRFPLFDKQNIHIRTDLMTSYTNLNYAAVKVENQRIQLYNFHFYPSGHPFIRFFTGRNSFATFSSRARRTYTRRQSEASQVLDIIAEKNGRVIVGGDFNDTPNSRLYNRFSKRFQNGFAQGGWGLGTTFGRSLLSAIFDPSSVFVFDFLRIDHIFCSENMAVLSARVLNLDVSDHRAQVVVIGI